MAKKKTDVFLKGYRRSGSFQFQGKPVDILLNAKTGSLVFEQDGRMVEDERLQNQMMQVLQKANKASGN